MINQKTVIEAYRKATDYPIDETVDPNRIAFITKFLEEYQPLHALEEFNNTPAVWLPRERPVNEAKKVALEALLSALPNLPNNYVLGVKGICDSAQTIYEWLIKPDTNG